MAEIDKIPGPARPRAESTTKARVRLRAEIAISPKDHQSWGGCQRSSSGGSSTLARGGSANRPQGARQQSDNKTIEKAAQKHGDGGPASYRAMEEGKRARGEQIALTPPEEEFPCIRGWP
jgi:hypothetical protein